MTTNRTRFWKVHGLGNDFIILDRRDNGDIPPATVRALCDRRRGIGADGILAAVSSDTENLAMRVFNADGGTADMCGNGLRCFVRWAVEVLGVNADAGLTIGSDAGDQHCRLIPQPNGENWVEVNLGQPQFHSEHTIQIGARRFTGTSLFLGNPHFVIAGAPEGDDVADVGPLLSTHTTFANGTNVEWLDVTSPLRGVVRVCERGVGPTQACGTGGGGAFAMGVRWGSFQPNVDTTIVQPGGPLIYRTNDELSAVWMTGPATFVCEGTLHMDEFGTNALD